MRVEYGHFKVKFQNQEYTFTPSFENITKIGSPSDIIQAFCDVNHISYLEWIKTYSLRDSSIDKQCAKYSGHNALQAAVLVLRSCCTTDCTPMVGSFRMGKKAYYQVGFESPDKIIILAQHLLKHGIIGESKRKSTNSRAKKLPEFNAVEYVDLARIHLDLSRDEAWSLTMTEFVKLFEMKFPDSQDKEPDTYQLNKDEYMKKRAEAKAIRDKIKAQRAK